MLYPPPLQVQVPFDGNSHKMMGLIAHPGEISSLSVSGDGNYLITAGGTDLTVNVWKINTQAVQVTKARDVAVWCVVLSGISLQVLEPTQQHTKTNWNREKMSCGGHPTCPATVLRCVQQEETSKLQSISLCCLVLPLQAGYTNQHKHHLLLAACEMISRACFSILPRCIRQPRACQSNGPHRTTNLY